MKHAGHLRLMFTSVVCSTTLITLLVLRKSQISVPPAIPSNVSVSNTTSSQVQVTWSLTHQHPDERAESLTLKVQFSNGTIAQQFQLEGDTTQQMVDTVPGMEYRATMSASNQYGTRTTDPVPFWTQAGGYSQKTDLVTSKDLVVRAVYYDSRARNGHQNASVFLIALRKNIMKDNLIIKCGVEETTTDKLHIRLIGEAPFRDRFLTYARSLTHEEIMLDCFDLSVKNGSRAFVIYKRQLHDTDLIMVESERPLIFPSPHKSPPQGGRYGFTVVACGKLYGTGAHWMEEWLRYQKTLGVDHVHWNVKDSVIEAKALEKPYIKKVMEEGYLSVNVWKQHFQKNQIWWYSQGLMYEDCIYRFRGTYDYIFMLDTDDFFTPRIHNKTDIHHYINLCTKPSNTGSCEFWWIEYYPDKCGMKKGPLPDGNVTTQLLSVRANTVMNNHKSLHKLEAILDAANHFAAELMPGYRITRTFPKHIAYVAHVRKSKYPKVKC